MHEFKKFKGIFSSNPEPDIAGENDEPNVFR